MSSSSEDEAAAARIRASVVSAPTTNDAPGPSHNSDETALRLACRRLDAIMDRTVKLVDRKPKEDATIQNGHSGIRLFTTSTADANVDEVPKTKKSRLRQQSDSSDEERKLSAVAVSGDWVRAQAAPFAVTTNTDTVSKEPKKKKKKKKKRKHSDDSE